MKKLLLPLLILITLILSSTAAYFSIYGLTKLFIGTPLLIVFFSVLEVVKIILVTLVNQFSKIYHWALNGVFIFFIIVFMFITSWGVFGYLTYSYTATSVRTNKNEGQIELLQRKDTLFKQEKLRYEDVIKTKTERIKTLSQLNLKQETRIDSMYNRGLYKNATKIENITSKTTENILSLNKDIDDANNKIKSIDDSIAKYDLEILNVSNNDVAIDVGPLKYVAQFLNIAMDKVVKYLIFLLISVSDPVSVALVIAINILIKKRKLLEKNILDSPKTKSLKEKFSNIFKKLFKKKVVAETVEKLSDTENENKIEIIEEPLVISSEITNEIVAETKIEDNLKVSENVEIVNEIEKESETITINDVDDDFGYIPYEINNTEFSNNRSDEFIGENGPILENVDIEQNDLVITENIPIISDINIEVGELPINQNDIVGKNSKDDIDEELLNSLRNKYTSENLNSFDETSEPIQIIDYSKNSVDIMTNEILKNIETKSEELTEPVKIYNYSNDSIDIVVDEILNNNIIEKPEIELDRNVEKEIDELETELILSYKQDIIFEDIVLNETQQIEKTQDKLLVESKPESDDDFWKDDITSEIYKQNSKFWKDDDEEKEKQNKDDDFALWKDEDVFVPNKDDNDFWNV